MSITLNGRKLFEEFQKTWTLEKVKNMTLEEYTSVKGDGERDDFTYWIENQLDILGSVWGGSAFKFGIYKRDRIEDKEQGKGRVYDKHYAWLEKYGKTQQEAFQKVKSLIMQVIECSRKNELAKIDKIDLGHAYKWKIAFHYQNPDNMKMFCIFKQDTLRIIADKELNNGNLPTSQIYMQLMSDKKYTLETSIQERSKPLFEKYGNNKNNKDDENEGDTMPNTPTTKNPPLNQILYGPPGTGKTYNTINKALEILGYGVQDDEKSKITLDYDKIKQKLQKINESKQGADLNSENLDSKSDRELAKLLFDYYCSTEQGQIEFVTFHQSFSYEEFVEGIKPVIKDSGDMTYKLEPGIFKKICDKALTNITKFEEYQVEYQVKWKEYEKLAHQFYPDMLKKLKEKNEFVYGDIAFELTKKGDEIQAKGTNGQAIFKNEMTKLLKLENSKKLDKNEIASGIGIDIGFSHLYEAMRDYFFNEYLKDKTIKEQPQIENELKPCILIIDEINRGNISKILGELITLIEPSKRIGASEEEKARGIGNESLKVTLPYSNETFGAPSNLYIIGTMNTADRSIALLDTALRRRFEFVEMMPEPELLKNIWIVKDTEQRDNENQVIPENRIEELDKYMSEKSNFLYQILNSINNRIEFLLDREHTIGHAFFFEKAKFYKNDELEWYELTLESLKEIFVKKIIPLLQEYFYDDYKKIQAVLNDNQMIKPKPKPDFLGKFNDEVDSEKVVYEIVKSQDWAVWQFVKIYDSKAGNSQKSSESNDNGE